MFLPRKVEKRGRGSLPRVETPGHDHFLLHAGKGREKKLAHIRESVCFAAIDFVVREKLEKMAQDMVQVRVGAEFAGARDKIGGKENGIFLGFGKRGMTIAKR